MYVRREGKKSSGEWLDGEIAKLTRPRRLLCGQDAPFPWLCRTSLVPAALPFSFLVDVGDTRVVWCGVGVVKVVALWSWRSWWSWGCHVAVRRGGGGRKKGDRVNPV